MTTAYLFDNDDRDLNGVECRALRVALSLTRANVGAIAHGQGLSDRARADLVKSWETSKGRGYPAGLVDILATLELGVSRLSRFMADSAEIVGDVATVRRPLGARRVHQLLMEMIELPLSDQTMRLLDDEQQGEAWQAMADAATVRAAMRLNGDGYRVRVDLDRQPSEAISPWVKPMGQSVPEFARWTLDLAKATEAQAATILAFETETRLAEAIVHGKNLAVSELNSEGAVEFLMLDPGASPPKGRRWTVYQSSTTQWTEWKR